MRNDTIRNDADGRDRWDELVWLCAFSSLQAFAAATEVFWIFLSFLKQSDSRMIGQRMISAMYFAFMSFVLSVSKDEQMHCTFNNFPPSTANPVFRSCIRNSPECPVIVQAD